MSRNHRRQTIIVNTAIICTLLCSSTIFSGLSFQSSVLPVSPLPLPPSPSSPRPLIMDNAYAQEVSEDGGAEDEDEEDREGGGGDTGVGDEEENLPPPSAHTNIAPIAVASAFPQNAKSNQLVTLDGSLSLDPDTGPQPLKYSWTILSGAPGGGTITLQPNANDGLPTFTAPQVL